MDTALYAKILFDKSILNLKKLKYKYPSINIGELMDLLKNNVFKSLPIIDFRGNELVFLEHFAKVEMTSARALLAQQNRAGKYGIKAMEEEISSTLTIENIDFSRESVRKILQGYAPSDVSEERIYGIKKGIEYISNPENLITEENIYTLYQLAIGDDHLYRHDVVYIMGQDVEHVGLSHQKLPEYMSRFITFINQSKITDVLYKAAIIHFYLGYLHPYFDGNGRMARLLHLWYLVQKGFSAALFIPFSSYINKTKKDYYNAFTLVEENAKISGVIDATPFVVYFVENVYNKLDDFGPNPNTVENFEKVLAEGKVTQKEKELWNFVLSAYGNGEFSTKQLERDFGKAAYATIRGFVLNFEQKGLLSSQKYGTRVKYRII